MLKSFINGKTAEETKDVWNAFTDFVKKNGHNYKPAKSEKKLGHGIEKIPAKKDRSNTVVVENKNDQK